METLKEICEQLLKLGYTQEETGYILGFSQAYVSQIVKGVKGAKTPAVTLYEAQKARDKAVKNFKRKHSK